MDKVWIEKLRALKVRLSDHLQARAAFVVRPDRSSLISLREGQRLQQEEEELASHLAQMAEFATGVPAEKSSGRLC